MTWLDCVESEFHALLDHAICRDRCERLFRDWCDNNYHDGPVRWVCHICVYRWIYGMPCNHPFDSVPRDPPLNCGPCLPARDICAQYLIRP